MPRLERAGAFLSVQVSLQLLPRNGAYLISYQ
ncbi:hypothetical protein SAMN02745866_02603 [Alteromonadaceae bacterium Bs31]|nr:hypothetical protein SAMN02745866_02603 [Alteromonadaceae bacterium Bs31]